ncbi:DUF1127 domain-containing protein [Vannielia sp.]|uniref:DUF1127 domain-containing protein n=1 Tax=Vannielia sp. TaxID=2813045 RepID=UPI0026055AE2|nr:DUF1127 domain-containing protein [Vannielia sp.]MDF1871546.1 DUF1127 domain-containing protein [Vannielia sp.]
MTVFTKLRSAMEKHNRYEQTRRELASMSRETALDLGLYPEDAAQTAYRAVYG